MFRKNSLFIGIIFLFCLGGCLADWGDSYLESSLKNGDFYKENNVYKHPLQIYLICHLV